MKPINKKKDRIFILVLAIVTAGLMYETMSLIVYIWGSKMFKNPVLWAMLICNGIAVWAIMYLIKEYKKRLNG